MRKRESEKLKEKRGELCVGVLPFIGNGQCNFALVRNLFELVSYFG